MAKDKSTTNAITIIKKHIGRRVLDNLNKTLKDKENPHLFLMALRELIQDHPEGVKGLVKDTGLGRRTIDRIGKINDHGTPSDITISLVLKALGFTFNKTIVKAKEVKP